MRSGDLDQQITIQIAAKSRGVSGEQIDTWQTYNTVWASVQTSGGSESFYNPQLVAMSTHKIKTRYIAGVKPTMQILWRGRILDIVHIDDSRQRQGELFILCQERVT